MVTTDKLAGERHGAVSGVDFLLLALRERTRDLHERIERRLGMPECLVSRTVYRRVLERLYGFYAPMEACLAARAGDWETLGLDFDRRRKTGHLDADLRFLGQTGEEVAALTRCRDIPRPASLAATIGCAYVLEGATLGGQVIARHLHTELGLTEEAGAGFYRCYGAATGKMWQEFRHAVSLYAAGRLASGDDALPTDLACDSARETFLRLEHWLLDEN